MTNGNGRRRSRERRTLRSITVIGLDGAPSRLGILDGIMHACGAYPKNGSDGVQAARLIVNGVKSEAEVDNGCTMVTIDNAQEYLNWH